MTTSLSEPPLFAALADSRRVLIAGAGGGFDVLGGVPWPWRSRGRPSHRA